MFKRMKLGYVGIKLCWLNTHDLFVSICIHYKSKWVIERSTTLYYLNEDIIDFEFDTIFNHYNKHD